MPGFSPHHGEGAVSTGLMVPVHDAKTVVEARAVVDLLERNQIPALVNVELEGILFPWRDPPKSSNARVLVPSKMLPNAREILRRAGRDGAKAQSGFGLRIGEGYAPAREPDALRRERAFPTSPAPLADHEDEGPIDLVLPEPGPLARRVLLALLAIALGVGLQWLFDAWLGASASAQTLGARAPVLSEPWRLVTAGFVHNGPAHLFSNALFAVVLGVVLFGTHEIGAAVAVWVLASMMGLATEAALTSERILVIGASAGNYGLLGLWAKGQLDRAERSLLSRRELIRTLGILLLLAPGALTPISSTGSKIAVLAHLGGFLAGFLLGFVFKRRLVESELPRVRQRATVGLVLAAALVVSSFAASLISVLS